MKRFILKLIQKYFLQDYKKLPTGELVEHIHNSDVIYETVGIYFSYELKPFLFVRDCNGYIFGVPLHEYKLCQNLEKIHASNS